MDQASDSSENAESESSSERKRSNDKRSSKKSSEYKSKRSVKRKLKTFNFGRWQRRLSKEKTKKSRDYCQSSISIGSETSMENVTCMCTGYRRTRTASQERHAKSSPSEQVDLEAAGPSHLPEEEEGNVANVACQTNNDEAPLCLLPENGNRLPSFELDQYNINQLSLALRHHLGFPTLIHRSPFVYCYSKVPHRYTGMPTFPLDYLNSFHSQIDYSHHLVPSLREITNCSFYWGEMDRYSAEKHLENKPEGTFLLRDSAQEEFLFSVSFRRYERTLHARVEQSNHEFSFDSHDPNVFSAPTVCELIEHYKNPLCCMFFEPMLTIPVHRNSPFSLTHLCRAVISDHVVYDNISQLNLPKTLKSFLRVYHYKQKVRVWHLEHDV